MTSMTLLMLIAAAETAIASAYAPFRASDETTDANTWDTTPVASSEQAARIGVVSEDTLPIAPIGTSV